jgi:hypothetical protein
MKSSKLYQKFMQKKDIIPTPKSTQQQEQPKPAQPKKQVVKKSPP